MRTVSIPEAFKFFIDIGEYNGEFAPSLSDFFVKLKNIPLKSIEFHFRRGDFERWIDGTLGDKYLAYRISKIDKAAQGEHLRTTIRKVVKRRLTQLKAATMTKNVLQ